jgi:hypothetical protein
MFDLQEFTVSCKQFVGAPDGARRVLDLMRSVVGDAEGIRSVVVPGERAGRFATCRCSDLRSSSF